MDTKRPWHPTKREWAEAKVAELRAEEERHRAASVPAADWRGVQAKMRALEAIRRDLRHYEAIAERFRAKAA